MTRTQLRKATFGLVLCLLAVPGTAQSPVVQLSLASDVVKPGTSVAVTITGAPGFFFALLGSSVGAGLAYNGQAFSVGTEFAILAISNLDSAGRAVVNVTPPFLLTTFDRYYLQAVTSPTSEFGTIELSPGRVLRNEDVIGGLTGPPGPPGPTGPAGPRRRF